MAANGPLYRIPKRYIPEYEAARTKARIDREQNPDERSRILAETTRHRKERDQQVKIEKTRQIARERTAERAAIASRPFPAGASSHSPAAPAHFDAVWSAKWQRTKGKPRLHWWAKKAEREAHSIELLAAAGRLPRRRRP